MAQEAQARKFKSSDQRGRAASWQWRRCGSSDVGSSDALQHIGQWLNRIEFDNRNGWWRTDTDAQGAVQGVACRW